jgi:hypothetical protein
MSLRTVGDCCATRRLVRSIALDSSNHDALKSLGYPLGSLLYRHPQRLDLIGRDVREGPRLVEVMSWVVEDERIDPAV